MANIHQEQPSIRNMQVVSSNCVHSTQSCEAYKCRIFKLFFLFREGFKKKKVKLGVLAEVRAGGRLRGG